MEKFIRRENLIIFKRRLAEAETDTQRQMLLKLLAEEEAREIAADEKREVQTLANALSLFAYQYRRMFLTKRELYDMGPSYGLDDEHVVLSSALELENLDFNELQAALDEIDVALAQHVPELARLAKDELLTKLG